MASRIFYMLTWLMVGNLIYSRGIQVTLTNCPTIQLDYHVSMLTIKLSEQVSSNVNINVSSSHPLIVYPLKDVITFSPVDGVKPKVLYVYGERVGSAKLSVSYNDSQLDQISKPKPIDISVVHSLILTSIINIIGWIYFVAWTISGYPQVYLNFRRRSVVGLNFDFICYNLTGFLAYSFFNVGLYYSKTVQDEYFAKYPNDSVIPVLPNDVFFALHAFTLTLVKAIQCFFYERGDQKVSLICKVLVTLAWLFVLCSLIPTTVHKLSWLTYLNFFSYIKLGVTLIKYIPQAYMNYKRKSTTGWSIEKVLLDFIGGLFSLVQMFLLSYNNDEWDSIIGNFTKFGLGLLSILFDILFMLQHYVFYQKSQYEIIPSSNNEDEVKL